MKKRFFLWGLIISSIFMLSEGCSSQPDLNTKNALKDTEAIASHPDKIKFPPLQITIPRPKRTELDNGLIVYLLENHELPLIEITARFKFGSIYDPSDKLGLANLTASLMRNGGIGKLSPQELDEVLYSIGANLKVSAETEEISFELSILKEDMERGFQILSDLLKEPKFDEKRLEFEKRQLIESFRRKNDNPQDIAFREFKKAIFKTHPYANEVVGTDETVQKISREDIVQFYSRYFHPNNMFLGISGDFNINEMINTIIKKLSDWQKHELSLPEIKLPDPDHKKSVNFVPKEINQTSIVIGHLGAKRVNPDYFSMLMMNAILGGSSVSRLYHQVREKEGLTYGIFSYFVMYRDSGMFVVDMDTKNSSVEKATQIILREIRSLQEKGIRDEELRHTKDAILSSFVFRFTNPTRILDQYIYMEYIGLPSDYLETYRDNIMKITRQDIQKAAKKYLHPDDSVFMFVGGGKEVEKQILEFGPVNKITLGK
jgi:predicted Zn-dependent peptidase